MSFLDRKTPKQVIAISTDDSRVRKNLRDLEEPVTYFGELVLRI